MSSPRTVALALLVTLVPLCLCPLTAHADIIGPPGDPARQAKIVGIGVADTGVGLLAGGIAMLIVGATRDPQTDTVLKADLMLAGGLSTAVGGAMALVGSMIWLIARKETVAWERAKVSLAPSPGGLKLKF
jgi:hypothetical protein